MNDIYMRTRMLQEIIKTLESGGAEYETLAARYMNEFGAQYELMRSKL